MFRQCPTSELTEAHIQQMRDILAQPPSMGPCCEPMQPGKGLFWIENHTGDTAFVDITPNFYEVPPKQGDVPGCLCLQLDPGHYTAIIHALSGAQAPFDIDIEAGKISHLPLSYVGY